MTELYEHDPSSLLQLLEPYLPASLMVYGTLSLTTSPNTTGKVYSTLSPDSKSTSNPNPKSHYTTIVPLPPPSSGQIRVFDTLESNPTPSLSEIEEGQKRVIAALRLYVGREGVDMVGGVHELWIGVVQDKLGEGGERPRCGVWVPRDGWTVGDVEREREGYVLEQGREEDAEIISQGSDISRNVEYYLSRIPYSTVIRPIPPNSPSDGKPEPICQILTHPDGSLGTLYTSPEYRNRGLAEWIVRGHIASGRGRICSARKIDQREWRYAVIFEGNRASQNLFKKIGWEKRWECAWVYVGSAGGRKGGTEVKVLLQS